MDSLSSAISIFNACLHAYRAICCATEMSADSLIWDVRMRIEFTRFEVWGRTLGFLDEKTGKERDGQIGLSTPVLELADILQVEAARLLVHDILESLQKTLEDFKTLATKYRLDPTKKAQKDVLNADGNKRVEAQVKRVWASTKDLGLHLVLALGSHNILFFYDADTTALRLDAPLITGFLYSRPDDQHFGGEKAEGGHREFISEGIGKLNGPLDVYIHPGLMRRNRRRYRRSDDIYSLGVILYEIAVWEPANGYYSKDYGAQQGASRLLEGARDDLAAEVGEIYQQAVIDCIGGLRPSLSSQESNEMVSYYEGTYNGEHPEYGIESEFLWRVVRQLEKLKV